MNWSGVIYYFLSITGLSGLCYFVVKKFIDSSVEVGLIKYKSELDKDLQSHKLQLDKIYYEHQIKFSQLHTDRLDSIKKIHTKLYELEISLKDIIYNGEDEKVEERHKRVGVRLLELRDLLEINRLYFNEDLCQKIESVIMTGHEINFSVIFNKNDDRIVLKRLNRGEKLSEEEINEPIEKWLKLKDEVQIKIKDIRLDMTKEFRTLIGVS